jgi:hypothetical protein
MENLLNAMLLIQCDNSHKTNEVEVERILQIYLTKLNKNEEMKEKTYIKNPNGTQKFPDFIIKIDNKIYNLECKSSKISYKPLWNCSYPEKDSIYIFTNRKDNNTVIFYGNELITSNLQFLLEEYKIKTKALEEEYNSKIRKLDNKDNPYKIEVYARNMFVQKLNLIKTKFKFFT